MGEVRLGRELHSLAGRVFVSSKLICASVFSGSGQPCMKSLLGVACSSFVVIVAEASQNLGY